MSLLAKFSVAPLQPRSGSTWLFLVSANKKGDQRISVRLLRGLRGLWTACSNSDNKDSQRYSGNRLPAGFWQVVNASNKVYRCRRNFCFRFFTSWTLAILNWLCYISTFKNEICLFVEFFANYGEECKKYLITTLSSHIILN